MAVTGKFPPWLKRRIGCGEVFDKTDSTITNLGVDTICTHANCPNLGECWSRGTATVLILGPVCTRNCKFCSVAYGKPSKPDPTEPGRIAQMVYKLGIRYLVITSVTRDDLEDGGASQFAAVIDECRNNDCYENQANKSEATCQDGCRNGIRFELLTPDFKDRQERSVEILAAQMPFVFGHNIETVPSLYKTARPGGDYMRSLDLLRLVKQKYPHIPTKSSMMLGLGETDNEVLDCLKELLDTGCDRLSLGQYLKSSKQSLEVVEFITPEKFEWWADKARDLGFKWVMSSVFTRSSYNAERD